MEVILLSQRLSVIKHLSQPLLGRPAIEKLQLLRRVDALLTDWLQMTTQYSEVFNGLGTIPGEYHIQLKANAQPYVYSLPLVGSHFPFCQK
jgi:hypothetical protein